MFMAHQTTIIMNANLYQNNDVVITSKSYSNGCNAGYTSLAQDLDEQINSYPSLIHVFSAGNDGASRLWIWCW